MDRSGPTPDGGGTPTREDAERDCLSAIAFALEGDPGIETHRTQSAPCGMIGRGEPGPQLACGWHAMGLVRHGVPQMRAYAGGVIHGQARAGR